MPRFTPPTALRVRAQWPGYYGGHRREGETFDFVPATPGAELPKWLVPTAEAAGHDPKAGEAAAPGVDRDAAKTARRNRAGAPQGPAAKDAAGSGGAAG